MIILLFGDEHLAIYSSTDIFNEVQKYTEKVDVFLTKEVSNIT